MSDPIMSPDGEWMWTGSEWIPAPPKSSAHSDYMVDSVTANNGASDETDFSLAELNSVEWVILKSYYPILGCVEVYVIWWLVSFIDHFFNGGVCLADSSINCTEYSILFIPVYPYIGMMISFLCVLITWQLKRARDFILLNGGLGTHHLSIIPAFQMAVIITSMVFVSINFLTL